MLGAVQTGHYFVAAYLAWVFVSLSKMFFLFFPFPWPLLQGEATAAVFWHLLWFLPSMVWLAFGLRSDNNWDLQESWETLWPTWDLRKSWSSKRKDAKIHLLPLLWGEDQRQKFKVPICFAQAAAWTLFFSSLRQKPAAILLGPTWRTKIAVPKTLVLKLQVKSPSLFKIHTENSCPGSDNLEDFL